MVPVSVFLGRCGGNFTDDHAYAEVVALVAVSHLLAMGATAVPGRRYPGTTTHDGGVGPLGDIPQHVMEAPVIWLKGSHGRQFGIAVGEAAMGMVGVNFARVKPSLVGKICIVADLSMFSSKEIGGSRSCPGGIFPLRL